MRNLHGRPRGAVESGHQQSCPLGSELLDDLALRLVHRHGSPRAGILLTLTGGHQPQEQLASRLLIGR